jgi:chromosomal replication initiator protein
MIDCMSPPEASRDEMDREETPRALQHLRVFLCHSTDDKRGVRALYHRLKASGVAPWLDEVDLLPGIEWEPAISAAVRSTDVVLICLSSNAVSKAGYIQREIRYALDVADRQPEGAIFIIPVRLETCDLPERLRRWQWVNLFDTEGYERLMVSLTNRSKVLERIPPKGDPRADQWLTATVSSPNPRFTFDTFVVGMANQFAYSAARSVAANPSHSYNPLFLYGDTGAGKTHLLHSIGHALVDHHPSLRVIFTSAERFMMDMIECIRTERMIEFHRRYRGADVLLIDDIQLIGNKERTQEEFYHTFNELHDRQKQIVISSDASPEDIPGVLRRLESRFKSGLVAAIQPPDLETKMAFIDKKAEMEGIALPDDVRTFIAYKTKSNLRDVEGAFVRIVAYSSLTGTPIDLHMAQQLLSHLDQGRILSIDSVQKEVARTFNLKQAQLKSKRSTKESLFPSQIAMLVTKELTNASIPAIGRAFGGRHHSTILRSISKISRLRATDGDLNRLINRIIDSLQ